MSDAQRRGPAVWRPSRGDQRRNVEVVVGGATLVVLDAGGQPLSHWSLAAIDRQASGLYSPGPDAAEQIELTDPSLIEVVEAARRSHHRPRPGRLRSLLVAAALLGTAVALLAWAPQALVRHASTAAPEAARDAAGRALLDHVTRLTGSPCATSDNSAALAGLAGRLDVDWLAMVPGGPPRAVPLPGGRILLNRSLVEDHDDPAVAAGHLLAAKGDAFAALMAEAGPATALRMLTRGSLADETLAAHAERLVARPPPRPPDSVLLDRFAEAEISATPYAYAVDITGESVLGLIEADPVPPAAGRAVLSDGDWVALQGACAG